MKEKCPNCKLVNYPDADLCVRCGAALGEVSSRSNIPKRAFICLVVCFIVLTGFYISLIFSAASLSYEQRKTVERSIQVLEAKGFANEAFMLKRLAVFRANDNWLNASVVKENAFAATNFPFEIVTLYPDFFAYPADDTERAAILMHEARHLKGEDEKQAYEFVWRNRKQLGWVSETYGNSVVWIENRKQTREYTPKLFVCDWNAFGDCTE